MIRREERPQKVESAEEGAGQQVGAAGAALVYEYEVATVPEYVAARETRRHECAGDARPALQQQEGFAM